ncbi:hypothetical protein NPIL_692171 [Nephila pilipes]|uniref:Uncharacterized protein n=1 Tax=Nephila pilipes TaxID=299642 RepID=A0A8X6TSD6_NEPPI|nr:hypothetical protein NPIL_692171 [Nephila pilipes]
MDTEEDSITDLDAIPEHRFLLGRLDQLLMLNNTGRPKTSCSNVNIEVVLESIGESPGTSIRRCINSRIANFKKLTAAYTD